MALDPMIQALMQQRQGPMRNAQGLAVGDVNPQTGNRTDSVVGPAQKPVSGEDMMRFFVQNVLGPHLAQQDQLAQGQQRITGNYLSGASRHLDMNGNEITGDQNPFTNGMFKSADSRLADMTNGTGAYAPTNPGVAARERTINAMSPFASPMQDNPETEAIGYNPAAQKGLFARATRRNRAFNRPMPKRRYKPTF